MTAFNAYSIRKRNAKVIINFEKTTTSCEKHSDFNTKKTKVTTHSMLKCNKKTPLIIEECCQSNKKDISLLPQTALEPRNTLSKRF